MSDEATTMRRSEELGIEIEDTEYARGYWARFDGDQPRSDASDDWATGWRNCDAELNAETQLKRKAKR